MSDPRKPGLGADSHEIYTRRKGRNLAMLACLGGVVLMIFAVTIVKLSAGIDMRGFDHTFETVPGADQ
ncbi:hypothetical protein [Oceanibium sediminis]|uniref:hypothetical protein n=1 Tax=Oceanibium sediminis TaxID=2026339 RepID=UPI000DD4C0D3|nr:hypothetical protein [Oceanibium sediminis]